MKVLIFMILYVLALNYFIQVNPFLAVFQVAVTLIYALNE